MTLTLLSACSAEGWEGWSCSKSCRAGPSLELELELLALPSAARERLRRPRGVAAAPKWPVPAPAGAAGDRVGAPEAPAPVAVAGLRPCEWCGSCYGCDCAEALCEWAAARGPEAELGAAPEATGAGTSLPAGAPASRPDWWREADLAALRALEAYAPASRLLEVRVVRHAPACEQPAGCAPWSPGNAARLCEQLGPRGGPFVAAWVNMGGASLLALAEVLDRELLESCVRSEDFLLRRLKLVPGLMKAKFPLPAPGPDLAEPVGGFFGMQNVSCSVADARAGAGPGHVCIQVDLYSKWYVRMGMQSGCFRLGNEVELLLVDAPGRAIIVAFRILVTEEFLRLLNGS